MLLNRNHIFLLDSQEPTLEELQFSVTWKELLAKVTLGPSAQHFFRLRKSSICTHIRFNIYPDGGVARLKVYGEVALSWPKEEKPEEKVEPIDLAAMLNGGKIVSVSDNFYSHQDNILLPGRAINMGDGWETKRSRGKNHREWSIVRLGKPGVIEKIEIDTNHFKGNYPFECCLHGCYGEAGDWKVLLPMTRLQGHVQQVFESELQSIGPITHVLITIFPDGGLSRVRIWGRPFRDYFRSETELLKRLESVRIATSLTEANFYSYGTVWSLTDMDDNLIGRRVSLPFGTDRVPSSAYSFGQCSFLRLLSGTLPYIVKPLERYPSSSQTFILLDYSNEVTHGAERSGTLKPRRYLLVAALPSTRIGSHPDILNLKAFIVEGNHQIITIYPGVWFHFESLDDEETFLVFSSRDTNTAGISEEKPERMTLGAYRIVVQL